MAKRRARAASASADVTRVRTTMRPWEEVEVDAAELRDLERQGLIHTGEAPASPATTDDGDEGDLDGDAGTIEGGAS